MSTQVPFSGHSTIKESARLHCPTCGAPVHYVVKQASGEAHYQPCDHPMKASRS